MQSLLVQEQEESTSHPEAPTILVKERTLQRLKPVRGKPLSSLTLLSSFLLFKSQRVSRRMESLLCLLRSYSTSFVFIKVNIKRENDELRPALCKLLNPTMRTQQSEARK